MKDKVMRWQELVRRLPRDRAVTGVEVGVWQGRMAEQLLTLLPRLTLVMVDRWCAPPNGDSYATSGAKISGYAQPKHDEAYHLAVERTRFAAARTRVMRMESGVAAATLRATGQTFDFIFIDGDHSYAGVKRDIALWRGLVLPGGLLCGHDYSADPAKKGEVKRAVDEVFPRVVRTGANSTWFVRM